LAEKLKVTTPFGVYHYERKTVFLDIVKDFEGRLSSPVVAVKVDNDLKELTQELNKSCRLEFVDLSSEAGERIYERSLTFIFIRAAREVLKGCRVTVEHSLGKGLYCELHHENKLNKGIVKQIEERMREIISRDEPITKEHIPVQKAIQIFEADNQMDKVELLKYRKKNYINIYTCGWLKSYFYGYLVPSTGYLEKFRLHFYYPGVVLLYPKKENPDVVPDFVDQPKLARIFKEAEEWGEILNIGHLASLNDHVLKGRGGELIRIAEALHEKKIGYIADTITRNKQNRIILIAGPSSSGKTTFAKRLAIHLKVNGLKPISISLDDYFVNREDTPRDEEGNPDYEALEAIDIELFNDHLVKLLQGKKVEIPFFNFTTGEREYTGNFVRVTEDQPIIIEGIHGLNEQLTPLIPKDMKFKIYVSALTQLNIDDYNRIPTTDTRILRRMVRDYKYRAKSPGETLKLWPLVRRGEEKNIFPHQEDADIMFNSALVYELAVLKKYAEPLLKEVDSSHPEYPKAKMLLEFLEYFIPIENEDDIPKTSIIREFIGGSCF